MKLKISGNVLVKWKYGKTEFIKKILLKYVPKNLLKVFDHNF